jgi:DNA-directed RNA polymerase subunit L
VKKYDYKEEDKESPKYKAYMREFQTMEINRIYKQLPNGEPYSFDFVMETVGTLDIPYIIDRAFAVGMSMMSRFLNINTEGFDTKANGIIIQPSVKNAFGVDFIMEHQDHTFGNMIQTYLAENHMAEMVEKGSSVQPIKYAGYEIPHQLRDEMVLRIGVDIDSTNPEKDARNAFAQACDGCYRMLSEIRASFAGTPLGHKLEGFTFTAKKPVITSSGEGFTITAAPTATTAATTKSKLGKKKVAIAESKE